MRTVSKISNAPRGRKASAAAATSKREPLRLPRRRLREEYASILPPKPRGRIREARRWLDVLTVRCTNGRVCERRPGARHISFYESAEIHRRGLAELEATDAELYKAVDRVMWEDTVQDLGIPLEEWKILAGRRGRRLAKVRAEMQRAGSI
jgi:hypothetical protein